MLTSQPHTAGFFSLYICFEMASESAGNVESNRVCNERLMEVIQNYCAYCFLDLNRSRTKNRSFFSVPFFLRLYLSKMTKRNNFGCSKDLPTDRRHVTFEMKLILVSVGDVGDCVPDVFNRSATIRGSF